MEWELRGGLGVGLLERDAVEVLRGRGGTSMRISRVVMRSGYVAGLNASGEPCTGHCV